MTNLDDPDWVKQHIGKTITWQGREYRLVRARAPTHEEEAAVLAKQAACQHHKGVHFTDPLTCAECGKVMP